MQSLIEMLLMLSSCAFIASTILSVGLLMIDHKTFKREKHKLILTGIISLCIFLVTLLIKSYS